MRLPQSYVSVRSSIVAAFVALTALSLSAQVFVGGDNFNDNTLTPQIVDGVFSGPSTQAAGQWRFVTNNANGTGNAWAETNQRMEYTTSTSTAFNRGFLGWVSPVSSSNATGGAGLSTGSPYTSSWVATVQATNTITSFTSGGFTAAGFEIYTTNATNSGPNAYYGLSVNNNTAGQFITVEWGKWDQSLLAGAGDFVRTLTQIPTTTITGVVLRMTYDGATKVLVADFSNDGGASFLTGATYDIDGAQAGISAPGANGLGLEFYASAAQTTNPITSGQLYFDNLTVSAIPEPSTYAALAGVGALGLALWRRMRRVA